VSQYEGGNTLAEIREELEAHGKILRRLDRRMRYATYGSILKWLVYIGIALGTFVWLQPYLEAIMGLAQKVQGTASTVSGFRESWATAFEEFMNTFKSQQ
jgi:hypothetical protein